MSNTNALNWANAPTRDVSEKCVRSWGRGKSNGHTKRRPREHRTQYAPAFTWDFTETPRNLGSVALQ